MRKRVEIEHTKYLIEYLSKKKIRIKKCGKEYDANNMMQKFLSPSLCHKIFQFNPKTWYAKIFFDKQTLY